MDIDYLRPFLFSEDFRVHTNHASLRWFMNVTDQSDTLIGSILRLSEFNFDVHYKKGICNSQSDVLYILATKVETILHYE